MIPRVLEPEAMETPEEVLEYDAMDHREVNQRFVNDFLAAHGPYRGGLILDVGTGTAQIPIVLAQAAPTARIIALDLSQNMLAQAARNIKAAGLADRIECFLGDAKSLGPAIGASPFEGVVSNTIVHHIPDPGPAIAAMKEQVGPGGTLLIRDLYRPADDETVETLVRTYTGNESEKAQSLFRDSLHAALTLNEIRRIAESLGIPGDCITMTSDRHWTLVWKRPT